VRQEQDGILGRILPPRARPGAAGPPAPSSGPELNLSGLVPVPGGVWPPPPAQVRYVDTAGRAVAAAARPAVGDGARSGAWDGCAA
jgi:hypothetical protein